MKYPSADGQLWSPPPPVGEHCSSSRALQSQDNGISTQQQLLPAYLHSASPIEQAALLQQQVKDAYSIVSERAQAAQSQEDAIHLEMAINNKGMDMKLPPSAGVSTSLSLQNMLASSLLDVLPQTSHLDAHQQIQLVKNMYNNDANEVSNSIYLQRQQIDKPSAELYGDAGMVGLPGMHCSHVSCSGFDFQLKRIVPVQVLSGGLVPQSTPRLAMMPSR